MRRLLQVTTILLALALSPVVPVSSAGATVAARAPGNGAEESLPVADRAVRDGLDPAVLDSALAAIERHGLVAGVLAIADMSQPSTAQRLVVIDVATRQALLRTWVAHGQGSGELTAQRFSNRPGSLATSRGLYRVGARIASPKHGAALLLDGLDPGLNDRARSREVIIHGADYVSAEFIARNGRLGRSWGCPAVPREEMARLIALLEGDGLLFVHGD